MRCLLLVWLFILCTFFAKAQRITGYIQDTYQQPVPGATVVLQLAEDSSIVKINTTDTSGQYTFEPVDPGKYFIAITSIGFNTHSSSVFSSGKKNVIIPTIAIVKNPSKLTEVIINSKRPLIEVTADKTIFNVDGSINAVGTDAMELLRKSPGVVVDKDDQLSLNGKNGVTVYIDGRPFPLSGQALSTYLRSLSSASIDAIEIISNPSARYDAAGNGGIINIKLKKNSSIGTNVVVNAGYSIGIYPKYTSGFSFNNRNHNINVFGNYNYNQAINESKLNLDRTLTDTSFDQYSITTVRNKGHLFKTGLDYFINKNNTIGIMVNGNIDNNNISLYSTTPIAHIPTGRIDRWLVADNKNINSSHNYNVNINYRCATAKGKELNMDADIGDYRIRTSQLQPNYYYDPTFSYIVSESIYQMLSPSNINIYSYKTDYEQDIKKGKIGFGGKLSYVNSSNDFNQYNIISNSSKIDSAKSNRFIYKENINAGYFDYSRQVKKFTLQAGLRIENSNISGRSKGYKMTGNVWELYDSSFKRNYTDFFPALSVTFNKNPDNQFGLSYSRRIDRPAYQDLNPFEIKIDEYSYYKGNTTLRPQYTNTVAATYSYRGNLNTKLSYSRVKDVFTRFADTVETVKSFIIKKNASTQKIVSLNINYSYQKNWYSFFITVNGFSSRYKADFGTGKKVDLSVNAFTASLQQSAGLGSGWTIEMNGFYNSPSIWSGTFRSDGMYGIETGFQKKVFKDKGNIRLSVSDILNSTKWHGVSNYAGQVMDVRFKWESQLFKLNFTYRLGNALLKAARQRKTSSDEEGKRVNSGVGGLQN